MSQDGKVVIGVELDKSEYTKSLNSAVDESKKAAKNIGDNIEDVSQTAEDVGKTIKDKMDDGFDGATDSSEKFKNESSKHADSLEDRWKKAHDEIVSKNEQAFDQMVSTAKTSIFAITTALSGLAVAGVKYNATIEQFQTSFEVMTGSAEKAVEVMDQLIKIGAETPFETTDLAKATQRLMAFGFSAQDAIDQLMILGDISQGDAQKLDSLVLSLGKMESSQKVTLEYLNIMIEQGFNPLNIVAEKTGETMADLYDRVSAGEVTIQEIKDAMVQATSAGGQFFQSMQKQSKTLNGQLSTLSDNFSMKLGEATQELSDILTNDLIPATIEFIDEFDVTKATTTLKQLYTVGKMFVPVLVSMGTGFAIYKTITLFSGAVSKATTAMKALNLAMTTNPYLLVGGAVISLIAGLVTLEKMQEDIAMSSEILNDTYENNYDSIMEQVEAYEQLNDSIAENVQSSMAETTHLENLYMQLEKMVGKTGQLTQAERERANFIVGELNSALGTEYNTVDVLEGKYDDLKVKIQELINTKKANILLQANEEAYSQALQDQADLYAQVGEQRLAYDEISQQLSEKEQERQKIMNDLVNEFGESWQSTLGGQEMYSSKLQPLDDEITKIRENLALQQESFDSAKMMYDEALQTIQKYEEASASFAAGNSQAVIDTYSNLSGALLQSKVESVATAEELKEELGMQFAESLAALEEYNQSYTDGVQGYTEEGLAQAQELAAQALIEYQKAGGDIVNGVVNGINVNKYKSINAVVTMANEMNTAFRNALQIQSPSKVMKKNASYVMDGVTLGIKENKKKPIYEMKRFASELGKVNVLGGTTSTTNNNVTNNRNNNVTQIFNSRGLTSPFEAYKRAILYGN